MGLAHRPGSTHHIISISARSCWSDGLIQDFSTSALFYFGPNNSLLCEVSAEPYIYSLAWLYHCTLFSRCHWCSCLAVKPKMSPDIANVPWVGGGAKITPGETDNPVRMGCHLSGCSLLQKESIRRK